MLSARRSWYGKQLPPLSFIGAPVVFQVIDSPCGVCTCILKLISAASGSSLACFGACTRIYSHFQSFGMHIICQCFHSIGKTFGIDLYISFFVSSYLPAVVDDQVFIACILHACGNHGVRHFFDELFAHIASEFVPAVPSHRRSLCQCVKYRVGYFFLVPKYICAPAVSVLVSSSRVKNFVFMVHKVLFI